MSLMRCCYLVFPLVWSCSVFLSAEAFARTDGSNAAEFRGRVLETRVHRDDNDGFIYTMVTVEVLETRLGKLPSRFSLRERGGVLDTEGESIGCAPVYRAGEKREFRIRRDGLGRPRLLPADRNQYAPLTEVFLPEDLREELRVDPLFGAHMPTDVALSQAEVPGLLGTPPRRFLAPDRGEPIGYLVDAETLPDGMNLDQAMEALGNALAAWEEVASVRFRFDGFENFGQPAVNISKPDRRVRIQLHDLHHHIPNPNQLGFGGQGFSFIDLYSEGGGGGRVDGNEFHETTRGFVVMNHRSATNQNPTTFEAALTHEIGHVLGLAHSSEDVNETDPELTEAMMYFMIHTDGRGATLSDWDKQTVRQTHPVDGTPPYGFERVMRIVTSDEPLANPEVNVLELRGYQLDGSTVTPVLENPAQNNGVFSLNGSFLSYEANGAFVDSGPLDPAESSFYDRTFVRYDDGNNLSPPYPVRVVEFAFANRPAGAPDGLPNSWREKHFGSADPVAGLSRPEDDPDGDGFTNLQEFLAGTDPLDAGSRPRILHFGPDVLTWRARPFEQYEVEVSEDLINWTWSGYATLPTSGTGEWGAPELADQHRFFRVRQIQ